MKNILSIDLEDWYHPEYVRSNIDKKIDFVNESIEITFDILKDYDIKATFFIVGEIAEKHPHILNKIKKNNCEIAFHGYHHRPLWNINSSILYKEIYKFNKIVKRVVNEKCIGFRAPSYSLNQETAWALKVLQECKFKYDSSIFPIKTPLYGISNAPFTPYYPSFNNIMIRSSKREILEFPALILKTLFLKIPTAGGFYLRTLPFSFFKKAIFNMNKKGYPAVISIHPWELNNNTPRIKLGFIKSFVTYHNKDKTYTKIKKLFDNYTFTSFKMILENNSLHINN